MSQLSALCESRKLTVAVKHGSKADPIMPKATPWTATLRYQGRQLTTPFFTGSAHTGDPTAADVLSCLISDCQAGELSFEDFCSDLGYDTDSRKAERIHKTCIKTAFKVRQLLGSDFNLFVNAEH